MSIVLGSSSIVYFLLYRAKTSEWIWMTFGTQSGLTTCRILLSVIYYPDIPM